MSSAPPGTRPYTPPASVEGPDVVVSTGFYKTHVTTAAHEAASRGMLRLAITAAYPTGSITRAARRAGVDGTALMRRFAERDEALPDDRVMALAAPELLDEAARAVARVPVAS